MSISPLAPKHREEMRKEIQAGRINESTHREGMQGDSGTLVV